MFEQDKITEWRKRQSEDNLNETCDTYICKRLNLICDILIAKEEKTRSSFDSMYSGVEEKIQENTD